MLLYDALPHLYPASWRAGYGGEMAAVFAARRRASANLAAILALWFEALADLLTGAVAVHFDLLRQEIRYAARTLRQPLTPEDSATPGRDPVMVLSSAAWRNVRPSVTNSAKHCRPFIRT